nr:hypothetical protein [Tanacetum cinerariifolium]
MDPNSSLEKICSGDDVVVISSDKVEGSGDWNPPDYQDTTVSKEQKIVNTLSFYRIEIEEISKRYIAPCFVNGFEAYDGEVNLEFDENLILNEYAVQLCLDYEVKKGKKLVKKELIFSLKGELYFVKFIINLEEDDPFEDDSEKTGNNSDDWDQLLEFSFDDVPKFIKELPPFICKMGKTNRNKKRTIENLNLFYQDIRLSSSTGGHLTQEEAKKEALAVRISQKFVVLEKERHAIEIMNYNDKYKKILDEIWKYKVELDRKTMKEEKDAVKRIKGKALKENDDPGAFIFPIRLEGKVNENALAYIGSDINTMPYQIYKMLGREEMKKIDKGITTINNTQAEAMGKFSNVLCQVGEGCSQDAKSRCNTRCMLRIRLHEAGSDEDIFTSVAWIIAFNINDPIYVELFYEFFSTYEFNEVCAGDELQSKKIKRFRRGLHSDEHFNAQDYWLNISREEHLGLSRSHTSTIRNLILRVIHKIITYGLCQRTTRVLIEDMARSLSGLIYCRDLDTTTLRDLIDFDGKLIPKDPQLGVPRVGNPRPSRASMIKEEKAQDELAQRKKGKGFRISLTIEKYYFTFPSYLSLYYFHIEDIAHIKYEAEIN